MKGKILVTFSVLMAVEVGLRAFGFYLSPKSVKSSISPLESVKVLCLGESTTALGGESSYPALLQEELGHPKFTVINGGMSSKNSRDIRLGAPAFSSSVDPDVVVLMMGINDYWSLPNQPASAVEGILRQGAEYSRVVKILYLALVDLKYASVASASRCPSMLHYRFTADASATRFLESLSLTRPRRLPMAAARIAERVRDFGDVDMALNAVQMIEKNYEYL